MFEVDFYKSSDGSSPVEDFLDSLENKMRVKALRELRLLEEYGNELREPFSKHLEDGIFELRVQQSNDIARALYFFAVGKKIVVTNGFVKKTQKTPRKEIELAKARRKAWEAENERPR